MATIAMGVDLAKQLFSVVELDAGGRVRQHRDLKRGAFAAWLAQLPPGTVVAMEACSGAHHWARRCVEHGLVPRLMAAQFVKPFRKSQGNKSVLPGGIMRRPEDSRGEWIRRTLLDAQPPNLDRIHSTAVRSSRSRCSRT